eukprot:scaffold22023_cov79-Skeletonema_marinoi.AAC.1
MVRTKSGIALAPGLYKPRPPDGMPPWAMNKEWEGRDVERPRSCLKKLEIRCRVGGGGGRRSPGGVAACGWCIGRRAEGVFGGLRRR